MIGWILLSRDAVARAAEALEEDGRGVRDEVGFLSLHQSIADHLFPGTSVLHTRARYALLVPWLMARVAKAGERDAERRLRHEEGLLAGQLVQGQDTGLDARGAIGARVWRRARRAPSQPPSLSYWSALGRWGILVPRSDKASPSRAQALRQLARASRARGGGDDDPGPDDDAASPFVSLPDAPLALGDKAQPFELAMTEAERAFLRRQIVGVLREDGAQSYLARLVAAGAGGTAVHPWSPAVARHADATDRAVLELARCAAALAAVGRAVYATLVEQARAADGLPGPSRHAGILAEVRRDFEAPAQMLDLDGLKSRFPALPVDLIHLMARTQQWLRDGSSDVEPLRRVYEKAERIRKGDRARLPATAGGRQRRAEWNPAWHPEASPLTYRWSNVRDLLRDVAA